MTNAEPRIVNINTAINNNKNNNLKTQVFN